MWYTAAESNSCAGAAHGGADEVIVRLGLAADGSQILLSPEYDHISLWCEDFAVDFGNAVLTCDGVAPLALEPEAAGALAEPTPAGPTGAAAPEAEAEAPAAEGEAPAAEGEAPAAEGEAPVAEGAAKPEAEAEAKAPAEAEGEAPAEAEAKPEGAAPEAVTPEAEAKPEGATAPVATPITAPEPEPEAGTVPEEAPTDTDTDTGSESAEGSVEETSSTAGIAGFASAGAIAAGAAVLLL